MDVARPSSSRHANSLVMGRIYGTGTECRKRPLFNMVLTEPSKYTALGVECRKRPLFVLNFGLAAVSKSILGQCQNLSLLKIAV